MQRVVEYFNLGPAASVSGAQPADFWRRELLAGLTTFLAMAYITVVNPAMLAEAGMDFGGVFVATCLAAAFGSILMGLLGNYPVGLAPGMGQNAFFTYAVVLGMGHPWQTALGAVFLSGILFVALSLLPFREWLINAIPRNLKLGISAGIGLFLGIVALSNAGVVVDNPATLVSLGDLTAFGPLMCLIGFVVIAALAQRGVKGAVVIGIVAVSAVGWLLGEVEFKGVVALPPSPAPVLMQLDIVGALDISMVTVILTMLLVDVFDTAGTMVGVANRAGLVRPDGSLPRLGKALLADSGATLGGALLGTSSTTSYIESAVGVEAGGRTGVTAIVCGVAFLLCLLFAPLAQSVPAYATAAALLFVACLMARSLADLDWGDHSESAPAVVTALAMPLGYSIADGIGLGFIAYTGIKLLNGQYRECPPVVYLVAGIFALKFAFL
ncbi:NCS2 family permease [Microbulbifer harenosus]|uniref:NCS2 family permease n=1 Tax=Microbulbifer harenosus TaxID=2576840 RepID=A0ABY2UGX8_9GAMM|nr:NCS2 family permease [Microbulbifer harenosus]TLM77015.1 NCS2 family permease [Microbulbifer harenosus]